MIHTTRLEYVFTGSVERSRGTAELQPINVFRIFDGLWGQQGLKGTAMELGVHKGQLAQGKVLPTLGKHIHLPFTNNALEEG